MDMSHPVVSSNLLGRDDEEAVAIRRIVSCPSNLHVTFVVNVSSELVCIR